MTTITRRRLLLGAAATAVLAGCSRGRDEAATTTTTTPRTTTTPPVPPLPADPFTLGVASGDPDEGSVALWTRLAPDPLAGGGMPPDDVPVVWEVASDEGFADVVASGLATAEARHAHSLHVVASGLDPDTWYWYRFRAGDHGSPTGRTRTLPEEGGDRFRFAFGSCQRWEAGEWTAHAHLAEEDVDLVVWLGDYIYEGAANPSSHRPHDLPEATTLEGYRSRYGLYKGDPRLQAAHARCPWLVVWDDHEVENNYAGAVPRGGSESEAFLARRAAAYQAWWEHQPTRLDPPSGPDLPIHRSLQVGGLLSIFALDGRQHRTNQPCGGTGDIGPSCPERDDPAGTMLGAEQEAWVAAELPGSGTTWNVLANQTVFAPAGVHLGPVTVYGLDQWDGYPAARRRMLDVLAETSNPVVITGDIHASAVGDLRRDPDDPSSPVVGTELVGTSVSSSFPADLVQIFEAAAVAGGAKMADATHRGYVRVEVTPDELRADYRFVDAVDVPSSPIRTDSSWVVEAGNPGVRRV